MFKPPAKFIAHLKQKYFRCFLTKRGNHRIYNTYKQNSTALIIVTEVKANLDKIRHWLKSSEREFLKIKFTKISFYLSENHIPVCPLTLSQDFFITAGIFLQHSLSIWQMKCDTFFFFFLIIPKCLKSHFRLWPFTMHVLCDSPSQRTQMTLMAGCKWILCLV